MQLMHALVQCELPVAQYQYAVTDGVHLLHDMGGQDDGSSFGQAFDQAPHVFSLPGVQAVGGLVQYQ